MCVGSDHETSVNFELLAGGPRSHHAHNQLGYCVDVSSEWLDSWMTNSRDKRRRTNKKVQKVLDTEHALAKNNIFITTEITCPALLF